jgi:hypothetical protein
MKRMLYLILAVMAVATASGQRSYDFAEKFISLCQADTTVKCITISPKMMEQLVKQHTTEKPENIIQAIEKLKSARIVTARAEHFEKADSLLKKYKRRFTAVKEYGDENKIRGAFYSRKNKKGQTVELVMLRADAERNNLTIVNLTGDIDEEFLCFLYNNKSFRN